MNHTTHQTCPHCGHSGDHTISTGSGPHYGRLSCGSCGRWLKWMSKAAVESGGGFNRVQLTLIQGGVK